MEIGIKLKQIRELKQYKREYLADKLGLSEKTIARIENNEISPTINRLCELAAVLDVSVAEILDFDVKQIFNNTPQNQQGGEFNAYNATDVRQIKELYERLLIEKDRVIETLQRMS
jgi:transcriptional regulator with XRE-family HTH domain